LAFSPYPKNNINFSRINDKVELQILADRLAQIILKKTGEKVSFNSCYWLMSDQIATKYI